MDREASGNSCAINPAPCSVPEAEKARKDPGHRSGAKPKAGVGTLRVLVVSKFCVEFSFIVCASVRVGT